MNCINGQVQLERKSCGFGCHRFVASCQYVIAQNDSEFKRLVCSYHCTLSDLHFCRMRALVCPRLQHCSAILERCLLSLYFPLDPRPCLRYYMSKIVLVSPDTISSQPGEKGRSRGAPLEETSCQTQKSSFVHPSETLLHGS